MINFSLPNLHKAPMTPIKLHPSIASSSVLAGGKDISQDNVSAAGVGRRYPAGKTQVLPIVSGIFHRFLVEKHEASPL